MLFNKSHLISKIIQCVIAIASITANDAFADKSAYPVGWHWYNEPIAAQSDKKHIPDFSKMTAKEQIDIFKKGFEEARERATLYPTIANVKAYQDLQKFTGDQASKFAGVWQQALVEYPELDYRVDHPMATAANQITSQELNQKQAQAIHQIADTNGILFFYRGNNPLDLLMSKIVSDFISQYGIAVIGISIDGKVSPYFPNSKINHGQAERLGLKALPAVIVVNPQSGKSQPVSYGFLAESDLATRFLDVATEFKSRY